MFVRRMQYRADFSMGCVPDSALSVLKRLMSKPISFNKFCDDMFLMYDKDKSGAIDSDEAFLCLTVT